MKKYTDRGRYQQFFLKILMNLEINPLSVMKALFLRIFQECIKKRGKRHLPPPPPKVLQTNTPEANLCLYASGIQRVTRII
jgi:hypothetical protein|tara:strand:+ start:188 stop:430 length:243 start_codon:yes stop_codon:yes gene_type:complete